MVYEVGQALGSLWLVIEFVERGFQEVIEPSLPFGQGRFALRVGHVEASSCGLPHAGLRHID